MKYFHNRELTSTAKTLRKKMTKEEKHLWYDFLRSYPVKFYRQKVIEKYVADFYCAKARLVIELDGSQHYDVDGLIKDQFRDAYLENLGLKVLHITNKELNENFNGVCMTIDALVKGCTAR